MSIPREPVCFALRGDLRLPHRYSTHDMGSRQGPVLVQHVMANGSMGADNGSLGDASVGVVHTASKVVKLGRKGLASPHLARAASVGTGEAGWALMRWRCRCRGTHTLPVACLFAHTTKDVRVGSEPMIQACAVWGQEEEKGLEGGNHHDPAFGGQYSTSQS